MNDKPSSGEVVFYEYPDIAYIACAGVTVTTDKTGIVWGYQHKTLKPIRKRTFKSLCTALKGLGIELPERFGERLKNIKHKGMTIKPSGLVAIKPISPLGATTDTISFQFEKTNISSFTRAIANATKTKMLIYDYQLSLRAMRESMHDSLNL